MSEQGSGISDLNKKRNIAAEKASTLEAEDHVTLENTKETVQKQSGATDPETHLEALLPNNNAEETSPAQALEIRSEKSLPIGDEDDITVIHSEDRTAAQAEISDSDHDINSPVQKKTTFSTDVGNSTATVKMLLPEGHVVTVAFAIGLTARDLKNHFANELKIPSDIIQVSLDGQSIMTPMPFKPNFRRLESDITSMKSLVLSLGK
ncbi:hypothetical protein AAFF_G00151440 [Aldrovandia affinis]|uniref:Ubiquitin-like domain-containing protein n=1 Tax=Aldrovandia affinis TaxID=143900 RepID=A0AAD7RNU6_9TELE|nr:hypothetical protein AAFF_G00151440 [Aldrovandia affinis]